MKRTTGADAEVEDLFVRVSAREASDQDLQRIAEWADKDRGRLDHFAELAQVWEAAGSLRSDSLRVPAMRRVFVRPAVIAAAAAACAIVAIGIAFVLRPSASESRSYVTEVGELRKVALPDGSYVHLNGRSAVVVNFQPTRRALQLEQGEAFFEVAHDPARKFVVEAAGVRVEAIGTAFNVDLTRERVYVTVAKGVVRVNDVTATVGQRISAASGAPPGGAVPKVIRAPGMAESGSAVGESPLAWREGILYLDGETLAVAVEHINRQSGRQLAIADVRLANLPIYGSFYLHDVDSFIRAVEVLYPIRHVETDQGVVLMHESR
jgi:transmembrane sensor